MSLYPQFARKGKSSPVVFSGNMNWYLFSQFARMSVSHFSLCTFIGTYLSIEWLFLLLVRILKTTKGLPFSVLRLKSEKQIDFCPSLSGALV